MGCTLCAQPQTAHTRIKPMGDRVVLRTDFLLGQQALRSNGQLVFTPVIEGQEGQTAAFRSVMLNGRRQHLYYLRNGNPNYPDVFEVEHTGQPDQQFSYEAAVPYEDWMDGATLHFITDSCGCGNVAARHPGQGIVLDFHPERNIRLAFLPPVVTDDPVLSLSGKAYLDYPVNRTELHPDYRNNPTELRKIRATIDTVRQSDKVQITGIDIHGYASPEGSWANNERLSKGRAQTLKEYVRQLYDFDDALFTVNYTPEDWAGLEEQLKASDLDHRDEVLLIVRNASLSPDARNEQIKAKYPMAYKYMLDHWYPALRHSDYAVHYKVRSLTDEEAAALLHTQPQLLSLNKLFRIANLYEVGSEPYNEVFDIAVRMYPTDPVANLNAANVALKQHRLDAAAQYLQKATPGLPQTIHAQGVLALLQGRYAEARTLLQQAQSAGITEATTNLEILQKLEQQ